MVPNLPSIEELDDTCYKSDRFFLKDIPNYSNSIYNNLLSINEIVTLDGSLCVNIEETIPAEHSFEEIIANIQLLFHNEQIIYASLFTQSTKYN